MFHLGKVSRAIDCVRQAVVVLAFGSFKNTDNGWVWIGLDLMQRSMSVYLLKQLGSLLSQPTC